MAAALHPTLHALRVQSAAPYGRNLVFFGTSTQGPLFEPTQVFAPEEAELLFGEGELAQATHAAARLGERYPWLIRLGEEGLSPQERFDALAESYEALGDFPAHVLVLLGVRHQPEAPAFLEQLAHFLHQAPPGAQGVGVLAGPNLDAENITQSLDDALSLPLLRAGLGEAGLNVALPVGPLSFPDEEPLDPAVAYGVLLAQTPPTVSPTNRLLPQVAPVAYQLTKGMRKEEIVFAEPGAAVRLGRRPIGPVKIEGYLEGVDFDIDEDEWLIRHRHQGQLPVLEPLEVHFEYNDLDSLAAAGLTAFVNRPARGTHTATAVTLGPSPYRFMSTTRSIQGILALIHEVALPFIGRPLSGQGGPIALEQAIQQALHSAAQASLLRRFEVDFDWQGEELIVHLALWLWHELNMINISTFLRVQSFA